MITLTNDFHHTSVSLRVSPGDLLSPSQIARARKSLCGISGCTCGGPLGERGKQEAQIEQIGELEFRVMHTAA